MIMQPDYHGPSPDVLTDVLSDLTLRQLLSFQAVAEEGSFHGAAAALEYTQSAVSQHVAALERTLDVRLFERSRGRRSVRLTEAGELFLRHVVAITGRLQAARADLVAYAAGEVGTLRVGVYTSVGARILPAVLQRFARQWPGVDVQLTEASDDGVLDEVELGKLDLTFSTLPLPAGPFEALELARDPWVLVVATSSPLANGPAWPPLEVLEEHPLLTFRSSVASAKLLSDLGRRRIKPELAFRTDDNATLQAMAAAGLGIALMPLLAVDRDDPGVVALHLDLPPRLIGIAWHRERYRTPASRAFTEIAAEVCVPLADELRAEAEPRR